MKTFRVIVLFFMLSTGGMAFASTGLIIHSAEFGVGKFHRQDNQVHAYAPSNSWTPYILPIGADSSKPLVINNADGSVTIFFSTLDDLVQSVIKVSADAHQHVSVLNVHGHGLPGMMWFPNDQDALNSWACGEWRAAADGSDQDNYSQYYSAVSPGEIRQIRQISESTTYTQSCTTGLAEWQTAVAKSPAFKDVFESDAQIHFLSCVVGLGAAGEKFTRGIAELLLPAGGKGRVETSTNFGLGDWSMPEGMGFWDLQSDDQVNQDNEKYVVDHQDREIAQKGIVRIVSFKGRSRLDGQWTSTLLADQDFLPLHFEALVRGRPVGESLFFFTERLPTRVRIPGTQAYVQTR